MHLSLSVLFCCLTYGYHRQRGIISSRSFDIQVSKIEVPLQVPIVPFPQSAWSDAARYTWTKNKMTGQKSHQIGKEPHRPTKISSHTLALRRPSSRMMAKASKIESLLPKFRGAWETALHPGRYPRYFSHNHERWESSCMMRGNLSLCEYKILRADYTHAPIIQTALEQILDHLSLPCCRKCDGWSLSQYSEISILSAPPICVHPFVRTRL
jgi:hypothetical protein